MLTLEQSRNRTCILPVGACLSTDGGLSLLDLSRVGFGERASTLRVWLREVTMALQYADA